MRIHRMIDALRTAAEQRRPGKSGQIVGVNVIGVAVVPGDQRRRASPDPLQRQAVGGIDPRRAQDRHLHPLPFTPGAQLAFGVDPPHRATVDRGHRARLSDPVAAAVTVDPAGTDVDQRTRLASSKRVQQVGGTRIDPAFAGGRREVKYAVYPRQALQRGRRIEIADIRCHPQRTQFRRTLGPTDHADELSLSRIAPDQPLRHIAKSDNQDFLHRYLSVTLSPQG
jgi:hypothetical protein